MFDSALYLRQRFSDCALTTTSHTFARRGVTYENVIATTTHESPESPLILAAHYDTVSGSPGADDNASALAVLLEVAHQLKGTRFKRPVQFIAFCLEEENLHGSRAFVAQSKTTTPLIQGAIVLECVGYARQEEDSQKIPPGLPIAVPTVGNFLR